MYLAYTNLSDWTRIARTAGPFDRLSIFTCKQVLSADFAICPPRASISLTKIPFAGPPIDGLHGIFPIRLKAPQTIIVLRPTLALAKAASIPACPPPITSASYVWSILFNNSSLVKTLLILMLPYYIGNNNN